MKTRLACIFLLAATAECALGQAGSDTTAGPTITIPAPENGIIYIRSGVPGGVRIRSRNMPDGGDPRREAAVDLDRLARVFDRQGLRLYAERMRLGGVDVLILRDSTDGRPVDTLSAVEATEFVESFGTQLDGAEGDEPGSGRAAVDLVTRIERSLLDIGLFRTLQIHFEFDRSDLLVSSLGTVEAVAEVLRRYPALRIEVAGHTDSAGGTGYNLALARRRAERVTDYLVELGVDRARVRAAGYGEDRPLLPNATATGRALNRRVEFRVLDGLPVDVEIRPRDTRGIPVD